MRRGRSSWSPSAAPTARALEVDRCTGIRSGVVVMSSLLMPFCQEVLPVRDDVGAISMDVQPGQRFRQRCALEESSLGAWRRL